MTDKNSCISIRNIILTEKAKNTDCTFIISYDVKKYIAIPSSEDIDVICEDDSLSFYQNNTLIKKLSFERICGLIIDEEM